ncbi:Phospholipase/carboxylesterase/thioesterase [Kockovaella imperatae]|uniref:Acyl-protein thioesterase 1 n=1 Tax=Kockovaella imperatae TaxID=4999 RepID=A0A1Y1UM85_9TREE|nr:Phospholipase/carboxylesterase/thioesterase [Kockovaella imperatae]ORX39168.1 Phospholipase/carboxylesterase/thioesterase [Kockovaella imperatae]
MSSLKHLKVSPKEAHTATIIFLHGLGDSGQGWLPVAKALWSNFPGLKWILPHAPLQPVTINQGMRMPSWFDLSTLDKLTDSKYDDERGLLASIASVDALIQAEVDAGIPESKIFLGGFSQGGAVAMYSGLTGKRRLGGLLALSTWIPLNHKVPQTLTTHSRDIPIFWGHGKDDPVVAYEFGERSVDLLTRQLGFPRVPAGSIFARPGLRFQTYEHIGHGTNQREIEDIKLWLEAALK